MLPISWVFGSALLALNLVVGALILLVPTVIVPIPASATNPEIGHNFIATVDIPAPFPYIFAFDTSVDPRRADATVLEDGHPLGPPHTIHSRIRSAGAGHLSFWSGSIYFSTSDNSDPRTNGRTYAARAEPALPRRITWSLIALDIVAALLIRRTIVGLIVRYGAALVGIGVLAFAARIAMAVAGRAPSLFSDSASTIDLGTTRGIGAHVALGFALTSLIFATGIGTLLWAGQRRQGVTDLLLRAFLPGTIVVAAAALMAVTLPGGYLVAGLACLVAALPLVRFRAELHALSGVGVSLLLAAPIIALYAIVLSFRFHGPNASIAGEPLGDDTIYVGWANMLTQHVAPLYNFAIEGDRTTYGNLLPSLFIAPFLRFGWFDPYLFLSASLPIIALLSLSATLPLLHSSPGRANASARRPLDFLVFACLLASSFRFPSVLVESPPFVFLAPIIVSTCYLAQKGASGRSRPWQAALTGAIGSAISKVVSFLVLVPLSLPDIAGHFLRRASLRQRIVAAIVGVCVLGYVGLALRTYLAVYLAVGTLGPLSWDDIVRHHVTDPLQLACVLGRDIGAVALAVAVARSPWMGLRLGVWLGVASTLTLPYLFHTSLTAAVLLVAIVVGTLPRAENVSRHTALLAALLMLPYTVVMNFGGSSVTLTWLAFVVTLTWLLARREYGQAAFGLRVRPGAVAVPCMITALAAVCLWGAGTGALHVGQDDLTFTPELRDIWLAVKGDTPRDALIFTDQTDDTSERSGGWDDFALAAQRQFYLVSWVMSPLRTDAGLRHAWLDRNAAVLSGALSPADLDLSRRYDGYYAVLAKSHAPPPGATAIYSNRSYAIYRLADRSGQDG